MIRLILRLLKIKYQKTIYQTLQVKLKTIYDTKIENKIHITTNTVTKTNFNANVTEIEKEIIYYVFDKKKGFDT